MWWKLEDSTGSELFGQQFDSIDPDSRTLEIGGTYTIAIQGYFRNGLGIYSFEIRRQAPTDRFAINIGDTVANGRPGAGAGNIELFGVKDIYNFTAPLG